MNAINLAKAIELGFAICAIPFILLALFFGGLGFWATAFDWTTGKALFFTVSSALNGMADAHLVTLGVIGGVGYYQ